MIRKLTGIFLAGLTTLLPLIITVAVIIYVVGLLDTWLGPSSSLGLALKQLEDNWNLRMEITYPLSVVIVVIVICIVGYIARQYFGQKIGQWFESLIGKIPFINKVYYSAEQVVDLFKKKDSDAAAALSNVVLVRFANTRILGMLANSSPVVINNKPHFMIYFPSSPVPATGFNYFVPVEDVDDVDISVEEMTRVIVSLGSLGPGIMNKKQPLILPRHDPGPEVAEPEA